MRDLRRPRRNKAGEWVARVPVHGALENITPCSTEEEAIAEIARLRAIDSMLPDTRAKRKYMKTKNKKHGEDDRIKDARILCTGVLCSKMSSEHRSTVPQDNRECCKCWSHDVIPADLKKRVTVRWAPSFSNDTSYQE